MLSFLMSALLPAFAQEVPHEVQPAYIVIADSKRSQPIVIIEKQTMVPFFNFANPDFQFCYQGQISEVREIIDETVSNNNEEVTVSIEEEQNALVVTYKAASDSKPGVVSIRACEFE